MQLSRKPMWAMAAAMCWAEPALARDCPCNQGRTTIRTASVGADQLPPAPVPEIGNPAINPAAQPPPLPPAPAASPPAAVPAPPVPAAGGRSTGAVLMPQAASGPAIIGGYQPQAGMNRWGMLPPPGTLGRTYQRRSALIPDDEHPRIGVVVVKLPEQANVSARGMKVQWTGEEWRLESSQPLVPGVPHIYAVTAEWETTAGKVQQTRWVPLIMGRVVDLEF